MVNINVGGNSLKDNNDRILENDPLEAIFALNMGDFLTEHLISDELLGKINSSVKDQLAGIKDQLSELITIYSLDKTLNLLGFNSEEDFVIYDSIAKTTTQMFECDACHIFLAKEHAKVLKTDQDLVLVGSSLDHNNSIISKNLGYKMDNLENPAIRSFIGGKTIFVEDLVQDNSWKKIQEINQDRTQSLLIVPMVNNSDDVGIICLENYSDKAFSKEFIELIEITARLFVTSMNLQELIEDTNELLGLKDPSPMQLRHLRTELTAIIGDLGDEQQMFVEALASAVDAKGKYEKAHSSKVANIAKEIANYLKLNEKTSDLIYYAGLLQNIGKITLPEELFNKKEKLSKSDWEQLQNHPNVGVNLLMKINFLSEVIPYIHYHGERWNGQGKPEGLSGNSIPLGSRIIAVADAFQAMITKRPYRESLPVSKAIELVKEEAGIKWDPVIVDALMQIKSK